MGSGLGAGAGADMLQEILRQKFEEVFRNKQMGLEQQRLQQQQDYQNSELGLRRDMGVRADAASLRAETAANAPVPIIGVKGGQMTTLGQAPHGAHVVNEPEPPQEKPAVPIRRVNPRTGKVEDLGEAPAGTHFVNEPPPPTPPNNDARSDRSYQFHSGQLTTLRKPYDDMALRASKLHDTMAQGTPQADALVAPELLTTMAGGQGSGLRMNEAEISRIVGGRSAWENLKASMQHWSLDPKSANTITPEQRQQIHALMATVDDRLAKTSSIFDEAGDALANATDPMEHRRILNDTRKKLSGLSTPQPSSQPGGAPKVGDRKQFPNGKFGVWDGHGWAAQ